jgi:hypothetical protein
VTAISSPPGYDVVSVDEFARILADDSDIEYPYREFDEDQEFRRYPGGGAGNTTTSVTRRRGSCWPRGGSTRRT